MSVGILNVPGMQLPVLADDAAAFAAIEPGRERRPPES